LSSWYQEWLMSLITILLHVKRQINLHQFGVRCVSTQTFRGIYSPIYLRRYFGLVISLKKPCNDFIVSYVRLYLLKQLNKSIWFHLRLICKTYKSYIFFTVCIHGCIEPEIAKQPRKYTKLTKCFLLTAEEPNKDGAQWDVMKSHANEELYLHKYFITV
jgi:hypothetical protein